MQSDRTPQLSVIVPTINEAENLPKLIADLGAQRNIALELIVSDGGSTDATGRIAEINGAVLVQSPAGRGVQMNHGAAQARAAFLLFLHADSRIRDRQLLSKALAFLQAQALPQGCAGIAGHFQLRFERTCDAHRRGYRFIEAKTALNRPNVTNGDQGFMLSRAFFRRLGGFDERMPFLEDQGLAEAIRECGRWVTLPGVLYTSARRFETEGFLKRYILGSMIMGCYSAGLTGFFTRARDIYRLQKETEPLLLAPFINIGWQMMREDFDVMGCLRMWYAIGRFVRQNAWHLFFYWDARREPGAGTLHYPWLSFYDRYIARMIDFRICDAITGLLSFIWFMGVLGPWFYGLEYRQIKARS